MIEKLLKAKHWQLFLIVFGLPLIIYFGWVISFIGNFFNDIYYESYEFPTEMLNGIIILILLMMIPAAVQYAWFWSMAVGLQKKLPDGMKMNVNLFKAFFIIPLVFLLLYLLFIVTFLGNIENLANLEKLEYFIEDFDNFGLILFGFFMFLLLSLFFTFCAFYQYWFIAKTIKSAQLQKEADFGDFVGEFFLVWFYPIGVWILQPVVNRLLDPLPPEVKKIEG